MIRYPFKRKHSREIILTFLITGLRQKRAPHSKPRRAKPRSNSLHVVRRLDVKTTFGGRFHPMRQQDQAPRRFSGYCGATQHRKSAVQIEAKFVKREVTNPTCRKDLQAIIQRGV